jgi:hypothetical protein
VNDEKKLENEKKKLENEKKVDYFLVLPVSILHVGLYGPMS